ncbi:hypothetical protein GTG28_12790 [Vibrio sp. OCN044]|uniref:Uncharacterized protein n=1 Tax=Vibrio tetraodonis subsp. pristinus TaxID=2695891 RepID=A0A6L8LX86_9VIBR|nr:hypothetical protein [Vibrio tetraodonis]MYM60103.1 hypothetical protein [Vibrio tetraodonis subsp. pristinus]
MINVFEGLIRQDVLDGKGGFEKILSEVEQTGSKPDDNKTFQTRECERTFPNAPFEPSFDYQMLLGLHTSDTLRNESATSNVSWREDPKPETHPPLVAEHMTIRPCLELSDYPAIRLNKVTLRSVEPEALRLLGSKQNSQGTLLECDNSVSTGSTAGITVDRFTDNTYQQNHVVPMSYTNGSVSTKSISEERLGNKIDKLAPSAVSFDTKGQHRVSMEYGNDRLAIYGGVLSPKGVQDIPSDRLGNIKDNNVTPSADEGLTTSHSVASVSPVIKPMPLSGIGLPHYQLAPELFVQYPKLNSYVVLYRNKYYLFEFNEHKMVNYLEYSDDSN